LIFADFGMKGITWREERERFGKMESFFYTSATEKSFFDYLDLITAGKKVDESFSHLGSAFTFQAALMAAPLFANVGRKVGAKLLDAWRARTMADIGMKPGTFSWERSDIIKSAASRRAEVKDNNEIEIINRSETALLNLVD